MEIGIRNEARDTKYEVHTVLFEPRASNLIGDLYFCSRYQR